MQDVVYIEELDQAITLLKPLRLDILRQLAEPRTCPELADYFGESPQKVYYHIKALETAALVDKVAERRVRGVVEGLYQAKARTYWLAPRLVGQIGNENTARDQISLRALLELAETVIEDTGRLGAVSAEGQIVPSLSMSANIHLPDATRRADFMREVQDTFQNLARKYGLPPDDQGTTGDAADFRLALMCYPMLKEDHQKRSRHG
jgi:DNA-binding transcriptional ArsR family regulator